MTQRKVTHGYFCRVFKAASLMLIFEIQHHRIDIYIYRIYILGLDGSCEAKKLLAENGFTLVSTDSITDDEKGEEAKSDS